MARNMILRFPIILIINCLVIPSAALERQTAMLEIERKQETAIQGLTLIAASCFYSQSTTRPPRA